MCGPPSSQGADTGMSGDVWMEVLEDVLLLSETGFSRLDQGSAVQASVCLGQ